MITTIAGIPCRVDLTHYSAPSPSRVDAEPDYCFEGDAEELEFDVLDRRGRAAPWLARKLTPAETGRIEDELRRMIMVRRNEYNR